MVKINITTIQLITELASFDAYTFASNDCAKLFAEKEKLILISTLIISLRVCLKTGMNCIVDK